MEILFCILIFIMGTVFGSFFTLAVYRIPLGLDITHSRSFCPTCNHRLEFKDLIPVLSYISLKGKCRYCGEKISPRYLCFELLSGTVFLIGYLLFDMNFPFFGESKIVDFVAFIMFYVTLALITGIDIKHKKVEKKVLLFGIVMQTIYFAYLIFRKNANLQNQLYIVILMVILVLIQNIFLEKGKNQYIIDILIFLNYILLCVGLKLFAVIFVIRFIFSNN